MQETYYGGSIEVICGTCSVVRVKSDKKGASCSNCPKTGADFAAIRLSLPG